jgi:hypothetical protein
LTGLARQTERDVNERRKMMGQRETMGVTGGTLRRMVLVLAVAALMAAMMVATAGPAQAAKSECKYQFNPDGGNFNVVIFKGGEIFKTYTTNRPPPSCTFV